MFDQKMMRLSDKQDISALISGYFLCLDERRFDLDSLKRIFTENAKLKLPPAEPAAGLGAIADLHNMLFQQFTSTHHMTGDTLFDFTSDDEAKVRCNLSAYHLYIEDKRKEKGTGFLIARCVVECSVFRECGEWRVSDMKINCIYRF